jgi:hypothetical protein
MACPCSLFSVYIQTVLRVLATELKTLKVTRGYQTVFCNNTTVLI